MCARLDLQTMAPSAVARLVVAAGRGAKRGLEEVEAPTALAVGDAVSGQLARSDLTPRRYVALADLEDNFELLRVVIGLNPTRVPPAPFLHGVLQRAHEMNGVPMGDLDIKKRAHVLKKLIQYVRQLWRRSEHSRIDKVEELKSLCRRRGCTGRSQQPKLRIKINHSQYFDPAEVVDLEQDTGFAMTEEELQEIAHRTGAESSALVPFVPPQERTQQKGARRAKSARPSVEDVVSTSLASLPDRAKPAYDIGSNKSFQAKPAECGSKIEVLLKGRAFRLSRSCCGTLEEKKMQFTFGTDTHAAWAGACDEVCSCGPSVWR